MIRREKDLFVIETKNTSYCFRVMHSGHLEHLYYGRKITMDSDYLPLAMKVSALGGTELTYSKEYPQLGLEKLPLEMSSFGKGDVREPFIEITHADGSATCDFLFKEARLLERKELLKTLPSAYLEGLPVNPERKDMVSLELELTDQNYNITLFLTYSVFYNSDVITRSAKVINHCEQSITLDRIMSSQIDFDTDDFVISTFHGAWAREMNRQDTPTKPGILINSSNTGSSSNRSNPFFMVSREGTNEDYGDCYGFNLIYSGNHYAACETGNYGSLRIVNGINPTGFQFILDPEEVFEAPEAVITYSASGFNGMSHNMHQFVRNHIVRGEWKDKERPILVNSWEANYFKFDEGKLIKQAKAAKEAGIELFVLDDGWFGRRNDDTSSLGDWTENRDKLKNGLKGLADKITALGMTFGIWVEPEMVNEDSECYRKHPDWAVKIPGVEPCVGRNQLILNLTREEVRTYIIEAMSKVFQSAEISYVKWDMNRIFSDYYSVGLTAGRQKEFGHRYILGLYQILDVLTKRFPKILFESCASGGNRFDLGMLSYMPQIWASDNTDAICRTDIQCGYSYGYPMSVIGAHVSACPNHQTLRNTSFDTRFEVAAFGLLGYELNVTELSSEELRKISEQTALYKKYRKTLQFGDFYRIKADENGIFKWMTVSPDKSRAVGLFLQKQVTPNFTFAKFITRGLEASMKYHFSNRQRMHSVKEFGDLINFISPIHIKKDSLAHNIIDKVKKIPGETEEYTAYGDVFNHAGVKLKQGFGGTGYNEEIRLFQDYASRMYFWEKV